MSRTRKSRCLDDLVKKGVKLTHPDLAPFKADSKPLYESALKTDGQKALFKALTD